jgi:hypothetical protein
VVPSCCSASSPPSSRSPRCLLPLPRTTSCWSSISTHFLPCEQSLTVAGACTGACTGAVVGPLFVIGYLRSIPRTTGSQQWGGVLGSSWASGRRCPPGPLALSFCPRPRRCCTPSLVLSLILAGLFLVLVVVVPASLPLSWSPPLLSWSCPGPGCPVVAVLFRPDVLLPPPGSPSIVLVSI